MLNLMRQLFRGKAAPKPTSARRRIDLGAGEPQYPLYVMGDVHGCLNELLEAENRIRADIQESGQPGMVILLGDYVDRGPASSAVLDHISRPDHDGLKRIALCGNHDDAFLQFIRDPSQVLQWLDFGGRQTLLSYGIDGDYFLSRKNGGFAALQASLEEAVPAEHIRLLTELPVSVRIGDYVFVHAGLRPGVPLDEQTDEDLMWIREPFLSQGPELPCVVVHGHTPVTEPEFGRSRIGMDTGAYFSGKLAVLKILDGRARIL
jgi:serine/threonine protein phosphatase 1